MPIHAIIETDLMGTWIKLLNDNTQNNKADPAPIEQFTLDITNNPLQNLQAIFAQRTKENQIMPVNITVKTKAIFEQLTEENQLEQIIKTVNMKVEPQLETASPWLKIFNALLSLLSDKADLEMLTLDLLPQYDKQFDQKIFPHLKKMKVTIPHMIDKENCPDIFDTLAALIHTSPNLEELVISSNTSEPDFPIKDNSFSKLFDSIQSRKKLTSFTLTGDILIAENISIKPIMQLIKEIHINNCLLHTTSITNIFDALKENHTLEVLNIGNDLGIESYKNQVGNDSLKILANKVDNQTLEAISLPDINDFNQDSITYLRQLISPTPVEGKGLTALIELNLGYIDFPNEVIEQIVLYAIQNGRLQFLIINDPTEEDKYLGRYQTSSITFENPLSIDSVIEYLRKNPKRLAAVKQLSIADCSGQTHSVLEAVLHPFRNKKPDEKNDKKRKRKEEEKKGTDLTAQGLFPKPKIAKTENTIPTNLPSSEPNGNSSQTDHRP